MVRFVVVNWDFLGAACAFLVFSSILCASVCFLSAGWVCFFSVSSCEWLLCTTSSFGLFGWLSFVFWLGSAVRSGCASCHKQPGVFCWFGRKNIPHAHVAVFRKFFRLLLSPMSSCLK